MTDKSDSGHELEASCSPVRTERRGRVLIVTIDRPEAKNAIDTPTAVAIGAAMDTLDADEGLTAAVITGAGGTFCAGMDLKAFLAGERPSLPRQGFAGLVEAPPEKVVIAAVEGYALAGGFEIALACDAIVATRTAMFGLPEVRRGLVAAGGGLMRLASRVPYYQAVEWAVTGEMISAERAMQVGLLTRLTEPGEALHAALDLADRIAANGPLAVRATKQILVQSRDWSNSAQFDRQREISEPVRASADAQEGARAFAEKRQPAWRGR